MPALTRPLLGLLAGFFIGSCSQQKTTAVRLKMPEILSKGETVGVLSSTKNHTLTTEDELSFSMAEGAPPTRSDALTIQSQCWWPGEPHRTVSSRWQGPFQSRLSLHELVPDDVLVATHKSQSLACLWDIFLKSDDNHLNFQKGIPVELEVRGGDLTLYLGEYPANSIHEYILEKHRLAGSENSSSLELHCDDLGSSKDVVTTPDLQVLLSAFLRARAHTTSQSDFLKCRLVALTSSGSRKFTPLLTLVRSYKPLTIDLSIVMRKSWFLEATFTLSNPNPFPAQVLLAQQKLWESLTVDYFWNAGGRTYDFGEGFAQWTPLLLGDPISAPQGKTRVSGYSISLKPHETRKVVSRSDLRGECWTPFAPQLGQVTIQLARPLPIYPIKDGSLISALTEDHSQNSLPVQQEPGLTAKVCR